jgi:hypothetical protein
MSEPSKLTTARHAGSWIAIAYVVIKVLLYVLSLITGTPPPATP